MLTRDNWVMEIVEAMAIHISARQRVDKNIQYAGHDPSILVVNNMVHVKLGKMKQHNAALHGTWKSSLVQAKTMIKAKLRAMQLKNDTVQQLEMDLNDTWAELTNTQHKPHILVLGLSACLMDVQELE